jgi:uncharacterized oxidoreductase
MNLFSHTRLRKLVAALFDELGSCTAESERVARCLVESNLVGHDSHGVIRAPIYADYVDNDMVRPNQKIEILHQKLGMATLDGKFGFGQVIGQQAMEMGIDLARQYGMASIGLRHSGHLGRIGDWPEQVAEAGLVSLHFVNTNGFGLLVAPFGGIDRRLSANPIAVGFPRRDKPPLILDISTSAVAEGKIKVARNQGKNVPENCIIDSEGRPTVDPKDFYDVPQGALLPFGGHKGYGLSVITELFAGALTANGCTDPNNDERLLNGMFSLIIDPDHLSHFFDWEGEVERFIEYLKSSRPSEEGGTILLPGEIEQRNREERLADGIPLDDKTWESIVAACENRGVKVGM